MSLSKVTIYGFANWFESQNKSLFDYLNLPEGIDRETVINTIMMRAGEFDLVYNSPDFMRESIRTWSAKWYETFRRWEKAITFDYDPLYNYDRHEEWTEDTSGKASGNSSSTADSTTLDKVSAFNSSSFENSSQATNNGNSTAENYGENEGHNKRVGRAYGNIGVTTSQQMLQSEYDIALWSLYGHIADIFCNEYTVPVY